MTNVLPITRRAIDRSTLLVASIVGMAAMLAGAAAHATEPPRPGEIARYRADGTLATRQAFVSQTGNGRFHPALIARKLAAMGSTRQSTPPGSPALQSSGNPKILCLLIDFPDYPHSVDPSVVQSMLFGAGNSANYPRESLQKYYQRSSYNRLTITGNVLGWYRASHNRSYYTNNSEGLIEEAINYYDTNGSGHDFAQYDNNGDGQIDYFCVFWTGPDTGWGSFWWGWMTGGFGDSSYRVDGKRLGGYSWMWEASDPMVLIHETGHSLGLPDYYDYDGSQGPNGGLGGLDMMDANVDDHNGFSKWMLDWVTPQTVGSVADGVTRVLKPSAASPESVAVMPGETAGGLFREFFLVENRSRVNNDVTLPTDGLVIWHVDARLDGSGNFLYNNSYTAHKLLRLMEADGLEEIEHGGSANAGDFYRPGSQFGRTTTPNSKNYDGVDTNTSVTSISSVIDGFQATITCGWPPDLMLKEHSELDTAYGIDNTYQSEPSGAQQRTVVLSNDNSITYDVKLQNDDILPHAYRLRGVESGDAGVTATYTAFGSDVSTDMRSTTGLTTPVIQPAATMVMTVTIAAQTGAPAGSNRAVKVYAYGSATDNTARDAVGMDVTVGAGFPSTPQILAPANAAVTPSFPTFRLKGHDPDGDNVHFELELTQNGATHTFTTPEVASDQECSYDLPADSGLQHGTIALRARTVDHGSAKSLWVSSSFTVNAPPSAPVIVAPTASQMLLPLAVFQVHATDTDSTALRYRLTVTRGGQTYATFDQSADTTGWSKTAYASGEDATYSVPLANRLRSGDYQVTAQAYDGNWWSDPSSVVAFSVDQAPSAPQLVSPANQTVVSERPALGLTCTDLDGDNLMYKIEVLSGANVVATYDQSASTTGWDLSAYSPGATATFTVPAGSELPSGTLSWRAYAYDGHAWGPASTARTLVVDLMPKAPTLASPANGICITGLPAFLMAATDPDTATGLKYRVVVSSSSRSVATYDQTAGTAGWSNTSYSSGASARYQGAVGNALAAGDYQWTAYAYDGFVWGPASETRSFTVPENVPSVLYGVNMLGVSMGGVDSSASDLGISTVRMRSWNAASQSWEDAVGNVQSGNAYVYQADPAALLSIAGSRATGSTTRSLRPGWNLIALPYTDAVPWDVTALTIHNGADTVPLAEARTRGWVEDYAWAWQPEVMNPFRGHYELVADTSVVPGARSELAPWAAYWVYAYRACDLVVPQPSSTRAASRAGSSTKGWTVQLQAHNSSSESAAMFGAVPVGRAVAIVVPPDPPTGTSSIGMAFVKDGSRLGVDVRSGAALQSTWEADVTVPASDAQQTITLQWPGVYKLPRDANPILVNTQSNERRAMRSAGAYTFTAAAGGGTYKFRVELAGRSQILRIGDARIVTRSKGVGPLTIGCTLSADATMAVNVRAGGKVVRQIGASALRSAGTQQIVWDGKNQAGVSLPSGSYLIEIRADGADGQVARVLVPVVLTR